jgi:hypothetical protein
VFNTVGRFLGQLEVAGSNQEVDCPPPDFFLRFRAIDETSLGFSFTKTRRDWFTLQPQLTPSPTSIAGEESHLWAMMAFKGVHRLALVLGAIASTLWLFSLIVNIKRLDMIEPLGWVLIFLLAGMFFLIPFLLVHGIAWVIRRFREDNKKSN